MSESEIRLECLRLAAGANPPADGLVELAESLVQFVMRPLGKSSLGSEGNAT